LPYGIYTIPEIATVGQTEEQLTAAKIPYETGLARYKELASEGAYTKAFSSLDLRMSSPRKPVCLLETTAS
jgi:NAD(P) transhydrogenase